jgi:hypothetical protein
MDSYRSEPAQYDLDQWQMPATLVVGALIMDRSGRIYRAAEPPAGTARLTSWYRYVIQRARDWWRKYRHKGDANAAAATPGDRRR